MATIGLMEGAYFVGRKEIMDFLVQYESSTGISGAVFILITVPLEIS